MKMVIYQQVNVLPMTEDNIAHWKTAEGPLAAALQNNLTKSITLGFKMVF
jgi:hypothetical protein